MVDPKISIKRREYVNSEYSKAVSGTSITNKKKSKLLKKLWRDAKKNIN